MLKMLTQESHLAAVKCWELKDIYNTVKTNKDPSTKAVIRGCKLPTNMVIILMSVDFKISITGYISGVGYIREDDALNRQFWCLGIQMLMCSHAACGAWNRSL